MAEADDTSASRMEILQHFQDITGYVDEEECRAVLERHNWDIETAVQDTLNEAEGGEAVFHPHRDSWDEENDEGDGEVNAVNQDQFPARDSISSTTAAVYHSSQQGWFLWLLSLPLFPIRYASSSISSLVGFIATLIWPGSFQARTTPLQDVLKFKEEYEEQYGQVHPTFYQGSYSQALDDAKRELRFLMVYLHCPDHQDTDEFCLLINSGYCNEKLDSGHYWDLHVKAHMSTLANEGFREYVNGNMLFWAANVKSPEGYRVSRALREATYPFLALICLRDNRMTVIGRMEGLMNVDRYVSLLARLIEDHEPALVVARADRQERTQTQQLRDEQDEAYYESVRADQEKERKKREEAERKRQEEDNLRQKEEARRNRAQSIAQDRMERKLRIPDEPDRSDPSSLRILIKLPNGKRLERRFLKSHSLQALYDFVFCDEEAPTEFVLVSNFPRKVYAMDVVSEDQTLEHAGIETNALLFVQDIEEESDSN